MPLCIARVVRRWTSKIPHGDYQITLNLRDSINRWWCCQPGARRWRSQVVPGASSPWECSKRSESSRIETVCEPELFEMTDWGGPRSCCRRHQCRAASAETCHRDSRPNMDPRYFSGSSIKAHSNISSIHYSLSVGITTYSPLACAGFTLVDLSPLPGDSAF